LITGKLELVFRKVKFINVGTNLSFEGIVLQESSTRRWGFQRPAKPFGGSRWKHMLGRRWIKEDPTVVLPLKYLS